MHSLYLASNIITICFDSTLYTYNLPCTPTLQKRTKDYFILYTFIPPRVLTLTRAGATVGATGAAATGSRACVLTTF
uniref:Uncharacterized protein n=1 Tax=Strigamia maritima TaxID=126957 RepID=T1JPA4_STRMM